MRLFAICDNLDAEIGLRLAGMECALINDRAGFDSAFGKALEDKEIGVLVLTEGALAMNPERVFETRHARKWPLMVTVPGKVAVRPAGQELLQYISDAIGVKLF